MGKKYKNIFENITSIDNLRDAYAKAAKGNRYTKGHLFFKEHIEANLALLQTRLIEQTYRRGDYNTFTVLEPKPRIISALPFRDRVVQHAINNLLEPIFDKVFYPCTFACRKTKGTHKGVIATQSAIRELQKNGTVYYLKMDFSKYFHSIDKKILFVEIRRKISDKRVLKVLEEFDGCEGKGIPIGNLLSQLFANIYGHIFDRFIKTKLRQKHYFRYMDDTVILSNDKNELVQIQKKLKIFARLYMKLRFSKWQIEKIDNKPLNFLGYRISADYKLIRKDSVVRAKRKIKRFTKLKLFDNLKMFLASWLGHIRHSDSFNLLNFLKKENAQCEGILVCQRLKQERIMSF